MQRPTTSEYAPYYHTYIQDFPEGDLLEIMQREGRVTLDLLRSLPESCGDFRYAEGKWTIKQLVLHMLDVERIMAYRALRIARGDETPLPGFDEDAYAQNAQTSHLTLAMLAAQWEALRASSCLLFQHFTEADSLRLGSANGFSISVRALAYVIVGHELHHRRVLQTRYLQHL